MIAAAPITDTVKRAREPRPATGEFERGRPTIAKTESRDHLWAAQTPQVFRAEALREALDADPQRLAAATDEAMLVEQAGGKVLIHPAPAANLKVTTPLDLRVAELLLGRALAPSEHPDQRHRERDLAEGERGAEVGGAGSRGDRGAEREGAEHDRQSVTPRASSASALRPS